VATKRQKTEVGIFLLGALALFAIVTVTLTGLQRQRLDRYHVEFEESIPGLTEGSRVSYRGVTVGKVIDLRVTPENKVGVTLGIDPTKVTVRQGIRARYSLLSIFGPYVVDLSGGTDREAPALEPGSFIPVQPSLMAGLEETFADTVPLTLQRATKLIERLDEALSKVKPDDIPTLFRRAEEALASAHKAIEELRAQTSTLAASLDKAIRSAQAEFEKTAGAVADAAKELQKAADATGTRAQKLLDTAQAALDENRKPLADAVRRLGDALAKVEGQLEGLDLAGTNKSLREAAENVGKGAADVGAAARLVAAGRDDVRRSLANVERDLSRSLEELDGVLRAARELLETLERDPSAILRGRRGEP